MTNKLTLDELKARGYVDVTVNLPIDELADEIGLVERMHRPSYIITIYNPDNKRVNVYITKEDFDKGAKR